MTEKTKIYKTLNIILRLAIILVAYGSIAYEFFIIRDFNQVLETLSTIYSSTKGLLILITVLILMPVNWGIEAKKWQYLIHKIEQLSFWESFRAVLSGVTVSASTPNRMGEYFGRVFILKKANPWKGVFITILGSVSQMSITLIMGAIASVLFIWIYQPFPLEWQSLAFWTTLFLAVSGIFLVIAVYFNIGAFGLLFNKITKNRWPRITSHIELLSQFSAKELLSTLGYSFLRYLIFTTQYILLFHLFNIPIGFFEAFILVSLIFFVLMAIPTIALAELGIRGAVAISIFQLWSDATGTAWGETGLAVLSAAALLWAINIVLPALCGSLFFGNIKFFAKRS